MTTQPGPSQPRRVTLSFQTRLTLTLLAAAIVPLGVFGLVLIATGTVDPQVGSRLLLFMFAVAVAVGALGGAVIGLDLVRPLREISAAVSRVSAGDLSRPIPVDGNDVLAQLAESHNRLASDAQRRNRRRNRVGARLVTVAVPVVGPVRRCRGRRRLLGRCRSRRPGPALSSGGGRRSGRGRGRGGFALPHHIPVRHLAY